MGVVTLVVVVVVVVAGLIFIVDSADRERVKEALYELENVITSDEMRGVPVEILANKQDLPSTSITLLTILFREFPASNNLSVCY